ncbi:MAG: NAD(+) salvage pathway protein [Sclerophora amabilis]|nr:MAG: NAD(+) salvage pathway protein [Sclerophora amabilis]
MSPLDSVADSEFRPALLVVDLQEDFCPPNGALAVAGGRDVAPIINNLLSLPFSFKVATKDWHPPDHVSFASNHAPPNNKPFTSFTTQNPLNMSETSEIRLWPVHCVQGTPGASIIPELDVMKLDHIVEKGQDPRVEMYSAFAAPFENPRVAQSGLADVLRRERISHVYVSGLAADYCVAATAVDACREGFQTVIVEEATRAVDPGEEGLGAAKRKWAEVGIELVGINGEEVEMVRRLG